MVQAFHRHIPILIRALGSSYSELLHIISDPPQGSENLLALVAFLPCFCYNNSLILIIFSFLVIFIQQPPHPAASLSLSPLQDLMMYVLVMLFAKVLQILTQETTPSSELIATVKHLYETKLKVFTIN